MAAKRKQATRSNGGGSTAWPAWVWLGLGVLLGLGLSAMVLMKDWGPVHVGSPAGDFSTVTLTDHPGWAVTPGMSAALPGFHKVTGPILRDSHEGVDTAIWLAGATPAEAPGGTFYEDRRPRTKQRMPGTAGSSEDGERLLELLAGITSGSDAEG